MCSEAALTDQQPAQTGRLHTSRCPNTLQVDLNCVSLLEGFRGFVPTAPPSTRAIRTPRQLKDSGQFKIYLESSISGFLSYLQRSDFSVGGLIAKISAANCHIYHICQPQVTPCGSMTTKTLPDVPHCLWHWSSIALLREDRGN